MVEHTFERSGTNLSSRSRASALSGRSSRFSKYTKTPTEDIEGQAEKQKIDYDTDIEGKIISRYNLRFIPVKRNLRLQSLSIKHLS